MSSTLGPLTTAEVDSVDRGFPLPDAGTRYNAMVGSGVIRSKRWVAPAAAAVAAILAAVTDNGSDRDITSGFTQPAVPRAVSATAGGTAADVKAIQVTVYGTNIDDQVISETLPAFTVNTTGSVSGSKAFKTITRVVIPAHDGTGATTSIGILDKLGLDRCLNRGNTVMFMTADGVYETTRPTVAASATAIESNTVDPNTALDADNDFEVFWVDAPPY